MTDSDAVTVPVGDFMADTVLVPDPYVPGRYHVDLSSAWNIFYVFGGMTMSLALRAAECELADAELTPLMANAIYISPVVEGPIEMDVEVLRRGKAAAQLLVRLRNTGQVGTALLLTAGFGRKAPAKLDYVDIEFPDVPPPEKCVPPPPIPDDSPFRAMNFHQQVEWLPTKPIDRDNWIQGPATSTSWSRMRNEPWRADGTIDPLCLPIPADHIGMAVGNRTGPADFMMLSLEIGIQFFRPPTSAWILQHCRAPIVEDGFVSAYVELWDGDRNLIASSTQRAKVRMFEGGETNLRK